MKYIIINATGLDQLMEEVQLKINEGWIPQGGVAVANASNMIFAQAMVKQAE